MIARAKPAPRKPKPPKRGRPSLGDAGLSRVISLKISNELYPRYVARAERLKLSVGAWLRKLADDDMGPG